LSTKRIAIFRFMKKMNVLFKAAFFAVMVLFATQTSYAQKASAFGLTGGYYTSSLWNEDDAKADQRLDMLSTLKYGYGVEYMGWVNRNIGVGIQGQYLMKGQNYQSFDTLSKITGKYSSNLNFAQVSLLVYHRSFNRYNPEARFRFVSYFGPYFAFLPNYREDIALYDANNKLIGATYYDNTGLKRATADTSIVKLRGQLYKNYDIGFVVAPGFECMISPQMALTFNVRADFGARLIENRKNLRQVTDTPPYEVPFFFWNDLYAKYNTAPPSPLPAEVTQYNERARTTTFTAGAFLGLRFYASPMYAKFKRNR
jgi:hypothetical protein